MKKILLAVMAVMMTVSMVAQCPKQKEACSKPVERCKVDKRDCKRMRACVYSYETRAMMRVDRISAVVNDLTETERKSLIDFYKAHFLKVEKSKETANPMSKEECRKECDAELRKVLGDERYIQYLEAVKIKRMNCERRSCGSHGERPCFKGERGAGCQRACASTCSKK